MMAKAHISVGMAAAFTVMSPGSIPEALPVITGASLGCLICDLDCENKTERSDSSRWRIVMALVAAAALAEDYLLDAGMWRSLAQSGSYLWFAGIVGMMVICTFASVSKHRGFSHSLSAFALETLCIWLTFPSAAVPFAAAFASHLVLDLVNKRPVRLFYPAKKGVCLGWFYADRLADRICATLGCVWLAAAVLIGLRPYGF
jgi:inner membrane protein